MSHFVSDVAAAANGRWHEVLHALGINVPGRKRHGPCPLCGGRDRFRLDDKAGRGTWICNQCGSGDGLDLVSQAASKSTWDAASMVANVLGLAADGLSQADLAQLQARQQAQAEAQRRQEARLRQKAIQRAASIIADTRPGVSAYLEGKALSGVSVALSQHVLVVGDLTFAPGAMVVPLYSEAGGELVNVQLIDREGNKRYLPGGQKAGAFHRIAGGALVVICEGVATGLSIHHATGATVYCALDAGNLLAVARYVGGIEDPLQPSRLIVCADNDAGTPGNPGHTKAMEAVTQAGGIVVLPPEAGDWNDYHQAHGLIATGAEIMRQIDTHKRGEGGQEAPQRAEVVTRHPEQDASQEEQQETQGEQDEQEAPEGFEIRGNHLFALEWVGRGGDARQELTLLSPLVRVLAETADESGLGQGRLLEWRDRAGRVRQWAMPLRLLVARNGEEVIASLLDAGLSFVNLEKRRKLATYLMMCQVERRVTCVERTGWHGRAYVLPGSCIGPEADQVILQSSGYIGSDFAQAGTLATWQRQIAAMAVGNSRLCFALSLAFAAPLLPLVGMEGGGFHLKGESTDGKTTVMKAAASVYGQPERYAHTWRATGNAIEGIASRRNDALLCLDELGELDGREAGQVAYMLANGQGKGRSRQDGELRERRQWRLLFLSTGELSLEDHAAEAGKRTQAGMEVRTIQIPSSTGHHGAFETLHGQANGRAFADALNDASKQQHGTAFRAFIEALAPELDHHKEHLKAEIKRLATELTPEGAGNQVGRAINRFALVAAAGELASQLGITGWPLGEATKAARMCLKAWLDERGHLGNQEDRATLEQVRGFVIANQFSRFADFFDPNHRPANMVGFRKKDAEGLRFIVLPLGWAEMTRGRDPKRAAQLCVEAGYLLTSRDRKRFQRKTRLPGMNLPSWVYLLTEHVLADGADGPEDE